MTPPPSAAAPLDSGPSGLRVLAALAFATIALAGMYFARDVIGPLALAIVIVVICEPIRQPLNRRGWPSWTSTTAVILLAYVILAGMGALLWFAGVQFGRLVSDLGSGGELSTATQQVTSLVQAWGIDEESSAAVSSLLDPATLLRLAQSVGGTVLGVATALFFVCAYIIFMAADGARYGRAAAVFGSTRSATIAQISHLNSGVRRYYVVNATFGAVVAVIDGLALWWMGIPAPVVWAVLAFVTNFVPNIGFVLGLIPPAILAFVVGGWPLLLGVIAVYCVVNVVLQVLVQPKFVSDAVDLSLTLSFLSVVFWTFIIGPLGAILSIPLTLLARTLLLDGNPNTTWLRWITGDRTAVPRPDTTPPAVAQPRDRSGRRRS